MLVSPLDSPPLTLMINTLNRTILSFLSAIFSEAIVTKIHSMCRDKDTVLSGSLFVCESFIFRVTVVTSYINVLLSCVCLKCCQLQLSYF